MLRFFLGERPVLPGAPTYYCGDVDQAGVVADDAAGRLAILPAQGSRAQLPCWRPGASSRERRRVLEAMQEQPHAYVARELPVPAPVGHPRAGRSGGGLRLSCYALCEGRRVDVMPGGLLRLVPAGQKTDPPGWQAGRTIDLVVLAPGRSDAPDPLLPMPERVRPLPLGSRAADNLFWAGRYAERAEAAARMLSIIRDVGLEEIPRRERKAWFPVWRGILEAIGHAASARRGGPSWFTPALAWHMTLDAGHASSLLRAVRAARENTLQCRDFFSPETWGVLNRLCESLEDLAARGARSKPARRRLAVAAVTLVLDGLAAFFGTVDRTMLHDTGWHFFQVGMHLERAVMTGTSLRHALVEAEAAARGNRREEADLTALVRLLSSQDAYRRVFQARTEPLFVADLLLLNRSAPKSVRACVSAVRNHLAAISALSGQDDDHPLAEARSILQRLDQLDLERFFSQRTDSPRLEPEPSPRQAAAAAVGRLLADHGPRPGESFGVWLDELLAQLDALGTSLHDFYLSHQSRLAPQATDGD